LQPIVQSGILLLVLGATLAAGSTARSAGALAAVAAGLALASLRAAPSPLPVPLQTGFVSADAALLALALVLGAAGALAALRDWPRTESVVGAAAMAAGVAAVAWGGRVLAAGGQPGPFAAAGLIIAVAGVLLWFAGSRIHLPGPGDRIRPISLGPAAGLVLGALVVAAGRHLVAVFLGVMVTGWSGWRLQRAAGGSRVPIAPVLTLVLLPACWLMATIAGPEGLRMATLGELPLSPAAELALTPALLLAGWAVSGLWPLHRQQPGPLSAVAGVLLVVRVAIPIMPEGLEHWRALALPVIVLGLWHAALSGRWSSIAVALAWVGVLSPGRAGLTGAGLLLAGGLMLELASRLGPDHPGRTVARVAAGLAVSCGALLAVEAGLRVEVVYTVLAVGGLVAAAGAWAGTHAITASEPSTAAPSI
jgi:hypothetical protein